MRNTGYSGTPLTGTYLIHTVQAGFVTSVKCIYTTASKNVPGTFSWKWPTVSLFSVFGLSGTGVSGLTVAGQRDEQQQQGELGPHAEWVAVF